MVGGRKGKSVAGYKDWYPTVFGQKLVSIIRVKRWPNISFLMFRLFLYLGVFCISWTVPTSLEALSTIYSMYRTIHFAADSALIRDESVPLLQDFLQIAKNLHKNSPSDQKISIVIEGYSDSREKDGLALSKKRAEATAKYFQDNGYPASLIVVKFYGASRPDRPDEAQDTHESRARNRRVYITFTDNYSQFF